MKDKFIERYVSCAIQYKELEIITFASANPGERKGKTDGKKKIE